MSESPNFIPDNNTIKTAVQLYKNNKNSAIATYGKMDTWDTSRVTNMSYLFSNFIFDNQNDIISNWDVSNVRDMGMMFASCANFNQPLNTWDVSQVRTMNMMFYGCIMFNQNISNWVLMPGVTMLSMFVNCPIIEEYKPRMPVVQAPVRVNAYQVHQAAAKINYEKLNEFLITKIQPIPSPDVYALHIKNALDLIIDTITETPEKKAELMAGIQQIYDARLARLNYREQSPSLLVSIINSLEYVKIQPENFKEMYIEAFVQDCVHAYQGSDGMTCAAGALERIIFSLVPACKTDPENQDYIKLEELIIPPTELIIQSIVDWYKSHNPDKPENVGAVAFPVGTSIEEKRDDLRGYLLGLYPGVPELIEQLITSHAEALDDDDFTYGGKKRNSRKRKRKRRRINKTRKRQKNKTKKTIHKRKNRT